MGGVSDGAPGDPLAGISYFKRRFPTQEAETGREMEAELRVTQLSSLRALQNIRTLTRRRLTATKVPLLVQRLLTSSSIQKGAQTPWSSVIY